MVEAEPGNILCHVAKHNRYVSKEGVISGQQIAPSLRTQEGAAVEQKSPRFVATRR